MELDVLYPINEEEIYPSIPRLIRNESAALVYYKPLSYDLFIIKKNIWALLRLLQSPLQSKKQVKGSLVIECSYENISPILSTIKTAKSVDDWKVLIWGPYFDWRPYGGIVSRHTKLLVIVSQKILIDVLLEKDITLEEMLIRDFSSENELVVAVGNKSIDIALYAKRKCRNIICFANSSEAEVLLAESVRKIDI